MPRLGLCQTNIIDKPPSLLCDSVYTVTVPQQHREGWSRAAWARWPDRQQLGLLWLLVMVKAQSFLVLSTYLRLQARINIRGS